MRAMAQRSGNGAWATTARDIRFELEILAHFPTFERNRLVAKLGSHELVDELTQTLGGLATVDICAAQSIVRHGIRNGIGRILNNRRASARFDPAQPASNAPDNTTPITRGPNASAADRNNGSTAGRVRFSRGPRESTVRPLAPSSM